MTKKVYCVLSFKASLLLLVSKPLNKFKGLSTSFTFVNCFAFKTLVTNKVAPLPHHRKKSVLLVSKPLKHTLKDFYCLPTGMTNKVNQVFSGSRALANSYINL